MNINEKLARWRGLENVRPTRLSNGTIVTIYNSNEIVPDYLNDDAAAMSLLDTLAERGYKVQLVSSLLAEFVTWDCLITYAPGQTTSGSMDVQTRRSAIVAAVLELIGKEDV